jgi:hypothetical protein
MPTRDHLLQAATRLHHHLERSHYRHDLLAGPDAGIRFQLHAWRFLKSALPIDWRDDHVFMQTQGYWVLSNWMLFEATGETQYREIALAGTEAVLRLQRQDGTWAYPLRERRHLVATVEGNWGATALLASYAREPQPELLQGAVRWRDFLVNRIGFQRHGPGEAINYFDKPRGKIPNNSVEAAWFFLRLWKATRDARFLEHVAPMTDFIAAVQLPSGELPYIVEGPYEAARTHYLCFQYNAFQFLKVAWSAEVARSAGMNDVERKLEAVMAELAKFLASGVNPDASSAADCQHRRPEVDYYTAVLAAALDEAACRGLAGVRLSDSAYDRLLTNQRPNGAFDYSRGDHVILHDSRSYPRPQAMTLFHLLYGSGSGDGFPCE